MSRQSRSASLLTVLLLTGLSSVLIFVAPLGAQDHAQDRSYEKPCQWGVAGQNLNNNWNQPDEHLIGPENAKDLRTKWIYTAGGDVSATPTVCGEAVYFPDWGGNLTAVDKRSGHLIWTHKISDYDGSAGAVARVNPAVDHDQLIIGDVLSSSKAHSGANVMAVYRDTGALHWITHVENNQAAVITGPPVVFDGVIYVGVSSIEEGQALDPSYPCCSFRGSVVALDVKTGSILWKTYDMPEDYSGGAIWQPPAIDPERGLLYIGTGNNYNVPAAVAACQNATPKRAALLSTITTTAPWRWS